MKESSIPSSLPTSIRIFCGNLFEENCGSDSVSMKWNSLVGTEAFVGHQNEGDSQAARPITSDLCQAAWQAKSPPKLIYDLDYNLHYDH